MNKLNLGSGGDYRDGWINLDLGSKDYNGKEIKIDVAHDLNNYPYPFENSQFDEIIAIGILEHIRDLEMGIAELSRISNTGCKIHIEVPYFLSYCSASEMNIHKFSLHNNVLNVFSRHGRFKLTKIKFEYLNPFLKPIEFIVNSSSFLQNLCERFPLIIPNGIIWEFERQG